MRGGTPAIALLESAGAPFTVHEFVHTAGTGQYGLEAAAALGADPDQVFKTLVVRVDGRLCVGLVPVSTSLSLKRMAAALGGKRAEMCVPADAERVTGYVVGGISPLGQRRRLPTVVDVTSVLYSTIYVSGGRRGMDIELRPDDLVVLLDALVADIASE
jgi:Cys-tRNA(Pro)/Cys-tRNA(Cys) deacylase